MKITLLNVWQKSPIKFGGHLQPPEIVAVAPLKHSICIILVVVFGWNKTILQSGPVLSIGHRHEKILPIDIHVPPPQHGLLKANDFLRANLIYNKYLLSKTHIFSWF